MAALTARPQLRAALFRTVDVTPACDAPDELAAHLAAYLGREQLPASAGRITRRGVSLMAQRFIAGETVAAAGPKLESLWRRGIASSLDLLGEATVTRAEGAAYAQRCADALLTLSRAAAAWPPQPLLEHDSAGPLPRAQLSVKVTALTPLIKPLAPARGQADAAPQLRALLRRARDLGAHLHIDMESLDSRETVLGLVFELLSEPEFRDGPSAGVVAQAYLRDAVPTVERILDWARAAERTTPLTVRLVKGAYWDQELISACQHGWAVPVWESQADTDACFRTCSELLLDAFPLVRTAVGSHNVDSIAHAVAYARTAGLAPGDVEYQVLRGLGDGLARALAREGLRCRVYSPVGDMVAGMAYLVRRLLENSANVGFATNFGS